MAETGSLQQDVKEQLEAIGTADIVIGLPTLKPTDDFPQAADFGSLGQRVLIACPASGSSFESLEIPGAEMVRYPLPPSDRYLNSPSLLYGSFHEVFQVSQKVGAKWCCVWNTNPQLIPHEAFTEMLRPMMSQNFDLAVPCYSEVKLGALITSSIIHPVVRALYGKRLLFPMATDLGFASQYVDRLLQNDPKTQRPRGQQWIATDAICLRPQDLPSELALRATAPARIGRRQLYLDRRAGTSLSRSGTERGILAAVQRLASRAGIWRARKGAGGRGHRGRAADD